MKWSQNKIQFTLLRNIFGPLKLCCTNLLLLDEKWIILRVKRNGISISWLLFSSKLTGTWWSGFRRQSIELNSLFLSQITSFHYIVSGIRIMPEIIWSNRRNSNYSECYRIEFFVPQFYLLCIWLCSYLDLFSMFFFQILLIRCELNTFWVLKINLNTSKEITEWYLSKQHKF